MKAECEVLRIDRRLEYAFVPMKREIGDSAVEQKIDTADLSADERRFQLARGFGSDCERQVMFDGGNRRLAESYAKIDKRRGICLFRQDDAKSSVRGEIGVLE